MADPKSRALERGRELEKAGRLSEAVAAFREAGAIEDAARVLAANKRVPDAVQLLMSSLGNVRPSQVGQLDAQGKKRALMAAILLVRNGEVPQAVELFLALGERARAVEALQKSGDTVGASRILSGQTLSGTSLLQQKAAAVGGQAETPEAARKLEAQGKMDAALDMWVRLRKFAEGARVARALGRLGDAAQMYAEAGQPVDAAWCYRQLGDTGKALENLVRVPRSDPRYRASAMEAVSLASELKVLNLALEQFVGEFVRTGPLSDHELPAFDKLARLYLAHDFLANAKEALQKLAARAPNYQDAFTRLKALEHEARATPMSAARVLADEEKRRRKKVEPLELPPLDDLPPLHDAALLLGDAPAPFEELEPIDDDPGVADAHGPLRTEGPTLHIHELPDDAIEAIAPVVSAPPPQRAPQGPPQRPPQASQAPPPGKLQPVFQRHKPPPADPTLVSAPPEPAGRPLPTPPPRLKPIALEGIPTPPPMQVVPQIQGEPMLDLRSKPPPPTSPIPPKAEASFTPGALVAGRYRLEERIGTGGMAAVFRATDQELDEQVALKVFTLAEASDVAVQRFKQELKLSRQLAHPNIIRLYDIGLHEGHRYISMELLRGQSLKTRLLEPIGFVEALKMLEQVCAGLQAAHDQGVVHRDVKPDNFFITEDGTVKVMDFGIAKQQAAPGVTVVGSIAGTPSYMSPEQISNFSAVGPATDLYALGIMAYEIFTGTVPFAHDELVPLLLLHVNSRVPPPREKNPGIPEELERVILRLLEKNPLHRHASARDVQNELKALRESYGG